MLIGRELCLIRVQAMEMMLVQLILFFPFFNAHKFPGNLHGNGHRNYQSFVNNFLFFLKSTTISMVCTFIDHRDNINVTFKTLQ